MRVPGARSQVRLFSDVLSYLPPLSDVNPLALKPNAGGGVRGDGGGGGGGGSGGVELHVDRNGGKKATRSDWCYSNSDGGFAVSFTENAVVTAFGLYGGQGDYDAEIRLYDAESSELVAR